MKNKIYFWKSNNELQENFSDSDMIWKLMISMNADARTNSKIKTWRKAKNGNDVWRLRILCRKVPNDMKWYETVQTLSQP